MERYQQENEKYQKELAAKQAAAQKLAEDKERAERERREIEEQRRKAEEEAKLLQEQASLNEMEKAAMEEEVRHKLQELEELRLVEQEKAKQSEEWKLKAEEAERAIQLKEDELRELHERQRAPEIIIEPVESKMQNMEVTSSNEDHEGEMLLQHDAGEKDRDEENRITESEKNKALQKQLEDLKKQLTGLRDNNVQVTQLDVLHTENVKQGRDKYKTLKQIRSGNTKQRVDQFEML